MHLSIDFILTLFHIVHIPQNVGGYSLPFTLLPLLYYYLLLATHIPAFAITIAAVPVAISATDAAVIATIK